MENYQRPLTNHAKIYILALQWILDNEKGANIALLKDT